MSDETLKQRIEWYIYEPLDQAKAMGARLSRKRCSMNVPEGRYGLPGQCLRKPKIMIEGYGFCTQHAKIVQKHLESEQKKSGE